MRIWLDAGSLEIQTSIVVPRRVRAVFETRREMPKAIRAGDCVKIPDGRIGRVREISGGDYRVRVRRKTGKTHQFLRFSGKELEVIDCPKGWMSPTGYNNYIKVTLAKMSKRLASKRR